MKQKIREKRKYCRDEFMDKVNNNCEKNIKAFWKFVNDSVKCSGKSRNESLIDCSGNSISSHAGKLKILKARYEKLGSQLNIKPFDDSWKEEASNSVKCYERLSL